MIARNRPPGERPPAPPYLTLDDVRGAAARLAGVAHRTPVLTSRTLDGLTGARVGLKAETLQRAGAFKFRGAYATIASLPPEALARGVATASSGNHAGAVALAARLCGTRATILMPHDAPELKRAAVLGYGAEVVGFDRYAEDREALLAALAGERGLEVVHPFDDPRVMAGQGTATLELFDQSGPPEVIVVPVGGGGLISGTATVARALAPDSVIVGVEPSASDDVARSLRSGARERVAVTRSIADGQLTPAPGARTWPIIQALADAVATVDDDEIRTAMRFCFERLKLVVEPSGASGLAALLTGRLEEIVPVAGRRVAVILSGGNTGPEHLV